MSSPTSKSRGSTAASWDGATCTVEDLQSVRGTRVNGERIQSVTVLKPGDKIAIGPATLIFGLGDAPEVLPEVTAAPADEAARMLVFGKPADQFEVDRELIIGRDPEADVRLDHVSVSRRHAKVRPLEGGGCVVTDLHSTAGSFVNGHRFDTHELTVGDRLQIGPFCFQFDGTSLNRVANTSGGSIRTVGVFVRTPTLTISTISRSTFRRRASSDHRAQWRASRRCSKSSAAWARRRRHRARRWR